MQTQQSVGPAADRVSAAGQALQGQEDTDGAARGPRCGIYNHRKKVLCLIYVLLLFLLFQYYIILYYSIYSPVMLFYLSF